MNLYSAKTIEEYSFNYKIKMKEGLHSKVWRIHSVVQYILQNQY